MRRRLAVKSACCLSSIVNALAGPICRVSCCASRRTHLCYAACWSAGGLLFADGLLTRRHKEMIATFVSLQNACPYCADSHGHFLRLQGASAELIGALETGNPDSPLLTEAERALLRFAGKVNANASAIRRSDIEVMMQAGWTEAQVSEAVHIAALFAAFNRIANSWTSLPLLWFPVRPAMSEPLNPRRTKRGTWKPRAETAALLRVSGNPINGVGETSPRRPSLFSGIRPISIRGAICKLLRDRTPGNALVQQKRFRLHIRIPN